MKNCEIKNVKCADIDSITKPFKVGDKVYVGLTGRVAKVTEIIVCSLFTITYFIVHQYLLSIARHKFPFVSCFVGNSISICGYSLRSIS